MSEATQPAHVQKVADALHTALRTRTAIEPVRDTLGAGDVDAAYAVQEALIARYEAEGATRVGRKVGLTNPAVQTQLGVDQPDFGVLLDDMVVADGGTVDVSTMIAPRIEAEIAFVLATDVLSAERDAVVAAVGSAVASFEIVDSRIRDWQISIVDTVADNASSALYALGATRVPLASVTPRDVEMTLLRDGDVVSQGTGRDCLGDPIDALIWVAETALRIGRPLRAGEVVLSGALGPMVPLEAGHEYEARITSVGDVVIRTTGGAQ